jgi:hypothetical protein
VDKADAARRVRALRALGVDPGTTVSERAAANAKADKLEAKYGKAEPPSVYVPKSNHYTMTQDEYLRWMYASGDMPKPPPAYRQPSDDRVRLYVVTNDDLDDIVEEGYLWAPDYGAYGYGEYD